MSNIAELIKIVILGAMYGIIMYMMHKAKDVVLPEEKSISLKNEIPNTTLPPSIGGSTKTENKCRSIVQNLTGIQTPNVRYPIFRNPKTKRNLEIDISALSLGYLVEYNGEQHYKEVNSLGVDSVKLNGIKERDALKASMANEYNLYLCSVPYTAKDNLHQYIRSSAPSWLIRLIDECETIR